MSEIVVIVVIVEIVESIAAVGRLVVVFVRRMALALAAFDVAVVEVVVEAVAVVGVVEWLKLLRKWQNFLSAPFSGRVCTSASGMRRFLSSIR